MGRDRLYAWLDQSRSKKLCKIWEKHKTAQDRRGWERFVMEVTRYLIEHCNKVIKLISTILAYDFSHAVTVVEILERSQ